MFPAPAVASGADYSLAATNHAGSQIARHETARGNPPTAREPIARTPGHDVSGHQGAVDWNSVSGASFTYVKASEGTGYVSPVFGQQYDGASARGIIRGAYHFARPDVSSGAAQADYFIAVGGGWRGDGKTLPGALDIEYNPYSDDACYGLDPARMTAWITDFTARYLAKVKRSAVIYTSTSWWQRCTGDAAKFGNTNPLWLAHHAPEIGPLPAGWDKQSIWQYAVQGALPGDQNYYNGPIDRVRALAQGAH
ncbi:GH25 family lysozyme [Amycolatopsis sp. H20-H5]|uniref:GH25 family lysozyme n=1 Tax=Amycolatopsis sp. H20-H5 TaxID=3046309 RepID=UPI002DBFA960|nr:GH25 family lysozyme [Amycolatopsis sp. H20-H5]MEC3973875.1 GH25 family lysozyme [Amycolatopsis sp. H20-H5]